MRRWLIALVFCLLSLSLLPNRVGMAQDETATITPSETPTPAPTETSTITPTETITLSPTPYSSWEPPIDLSEGVTTDWRAFAVAACDRYQNLHIFWANNVDTGADIYYRTDANGEWTAPIDIIALSYPRVHYLTTLISPKTNTVFLSWVSMTPGDLLFTQTSLFDVRNPRKWLVPRRLDNYVFNPAMALDSKGRLHMVYAASDEDDLNWDVLHIVSEDDGITWSDPDVAFSTTFPKPSYIRVEMAIDGRDRIHAGLTLRSMQHGGYSEVGYIRSEDDGKTWTDYLMIDRQKAETDQKEWIAPYAFGDDEIHLTWHNPGRLHMWSSDGGKTWSEPDVIMRLGAAFGGPNMLVKDSAGVIHAVIAISNGVYEVAWNGTNWTTPELVDPREIDPHGQFMTVCQGNILNIMYYDRTGGTTVWYSWKEEADTPKLVRIPMPTITSTATSIPTPTPLSSLDAVTPTPKLSTEQTDPESFGYIPKPLDPILKGLAPAFVLMLLVLFARMIKSH